MKILSRWMARLTLTPLAVMTLQGVVPEAYAFTDSNAELKEAARDQRAVATSKAVRAPAQAVWVPTTAKKLDGFKPVLPPEPELTRAVAKADLPASARR